MAFRAIIVGALCGVFVPLCGSWGQGRNAGDLDTLTTTEPAIDFAILDPDEKMTVWSGTRLQVALLGGTARSGIGVKSLKVSVPPGLALRKSGENSKTFEIDVIPSALQLKPGERRELSPIELVPIPYAQLDGQLLDILWYRPRKEAFVATLSYETLADKRQGVKSSKLVVAARAHPFGTYAGGLVGSLLVAIFLVLPPVRVARGATPEPAPPPKGLRERTREFFIRFMRGAVVTAIAILILQSTADLSLPVSITVQDFYGGVVLGLFGDKLAETIQSWIQK